MQCVSCPLQSQPDHMASHVYASIHQSWRSSCLRCLLWQLRMLSDVMLLLCMEWHC